MGQIDRLCGEGVHGPHLCRCNLRLKAHTAVEPDDLESVRNGLRLIGNLCIQSESLRLFVLRCAQRIRVEGDGHGSQIRRV